MKKFNLQNKNIIKIGIVVCSIILIICAIFIMRYYLSLETEAVYIEDLRTEYVNYTPSQSAPNSEVSSATTEESALPENIMRYITINDYPVPYQIINFNALREYQNSDIYAWITIPDCTIDYPIVQHPTDNNYYIDHNLNGSSGYPGCIYTENYNTTSWNDSNTILYGHNMKNGTMFADLHKYADADFFKEHPYVYIYTDDYVRIYQVFAAYPFSNDHLYTLCDWENEDAVNKYFSGIFSNTGNFNKTVTLDGTSKILTLSTCIKNQNEKRFLVQAVLVGEGGIE